jgi:hypothetical protein
MTLGVAQGWGRPLLRSWRGAASAVYHIRSTVYGSYVPLPNNARGGLGREGNVRAVDIRPNSVRARLIRALEFGYLRAQPASVPVPRDSGAGAACAGHHIEG